MGSIVLSLDNAAFRKGFEGGRRYYFVDANGEESQRAMKLSARIVELDCVPDARSSHYRFDEEEIDYLEEYLGTWACFLGR